MVDKFQAEFKMDHSYQTSEILRINQQYSVLHEINNSKAIGSSIRFLQFILLNKIQASSDNLVVLTKNFFGVKYT